MVCARRFVSKSHSSVGGAVWRIRQKDQGGDGSSSDQEYLITIKKIDHNVHRPTLRSCDINTDTDRRADKLTRPCRANDKA